VAHRTDEQLARLRVAIATGRLPADLGEWILSRMQSAGARRAHRVKELRRAAEAMQTSRKAAARELAEIVSCFEEYPGLVAVAWYPDGSPERIVQQLMRAGTLPRSMRNMQRLL
jgi:hypothetical protein